jgi:hypothetical protein
MLLLALDFGRHPTARVMAKHCCNASSLGSELAEDFCDPGGTAPTMLDIIIERAANEGVPDLASARLHGLVLLMHATKDAIHRTFEPPIAAVMFNAFARDVFAGHERTRRGERGRLEKLFSEMDPVYANAIASTEGRDPKTESRVCRHFCKAIHRPAQCEPATSRLIEGYWSEYAATVTRFLEDVPEFCTVVPS